MPPGPHGRPGGGNGDEEDGRVGWASGVRGADVRVAFGLGLAVLLGGLTGLNSGVGWLGGGLSLAMPCWKDALGLAIPCVEPEPSLAVPCRKAALSLAMLCWKGALGLAISCMELGLSPAVPFRNAVLSLAMPCL